jgi:hypothetical protein
MSRLRAKISESPKAPSLSTYETEQMFAATVETREDEVSRF